MRITSNGFSKHTSDSGNYVSSTGNYHEFRSNSGNNPNTIFFHNGVGNTQFGIKIQTANEQNDTSHHFIDCREGGSATRRFIVYANGNVQNSNNSYGQLSDIKLKENVVDSNSQWNDIKQLKVRNFNFKNDNTNLKQIGLIAQEAEIVCPSLVFESQDQEEDAETGEIKDKGTTTKSVKYSVLYMKAIKCLQEAMARIEALETKVAALEAA
jgi:putative ribosome biogenesis GTPase RsgA